LNLETAVRLALPIVVAIALSLAPFAGAQEATEEDLVDPEVPQQERICDQEIDEVEASLEAKIDAFEPAEQERLRRQLVEAQELCDDDNEVMAAIRLEAVTAIIEVTGVAD
jgi:hypothetical protein